LILIVGSWHASTTENEKKHQEKGTLLESGKKETRKLLSQNCFPWPPGLIYHDKTKARRFLAALSGEIHLPHPTKNVSFCFYLFFFFFNGRDGNNGAMNISAFYSFRSFFYLGQATGKKKGAAFTSPQQQHTT